MIMAIESSCDDSSIAIIEISSNKILFHKKISQELDHATYGGVVPELAARLHTEALPKILEQCGEFLVSLKAVSVTTHPGLSVSLNEGVAMAKALSVALNLPLVSVNHLKGHIYSLFIGLNEIFPITVLLVSGGHSLIVEALSHENMQIKLRSSDDSLGESFDKVAKMLGLGYPGGPIVEQYAKNGDPQRFAFPVPLKHSNRLEFSYSGLKNAVKLRIDELNELSHQDICDVCAGFQSVAIAHIIQKCKQYFKIAKPKNFAVVGGASANISLRKELENLANDFGYKLMVADLEYCSDNAAMIARCAVEDFKRNNFCELENLSIMTKSGDIL